MEAWACWAQREASAVALGTWQVGTRVELTQNAERFNGATYPAGTRGTVRESSPDGLLVELDGEWPELAAWGGCLQFLPEDVESGPIGVCKARNPRELAQEAFTEALLHIQGALGITDGGFASMWWCGEREAQVLAALEAYAEAEIESENE